MMEDRAEGEEASSFAESPPVERSAEVNMLRISAGAAGATLLVEITRLLLPRAGFEPGFPWFGPRPIPSFLLLAVALLLHSSLRRNRVWMQRVLAGSAIALLALFDIFKPAHSPVTVVAAAVIAIAVLVASLQTRRAAVISQCLAIGVAFASITRLLILLFGVRELEGATSHAYVSLASAVSLGLLSLSVLHSRPNEGIMKAISSTGAGARMARSLLPAAVLLPPILGALVVAAVDRGLFRSRVGLALFVESIIVLFTVLIWRSAGALHGMERLRLRAEQSLRNARDELESRVRARTAELQTLNAELESFAYSVSHDLRTPLRAIDGFSRILLEDHREQLDEEGRRLLDVVRDNTRRMAALIHDLLAFSRISRQAIEGETVDLTDLARAVFAQLGAEGRMALRADSTPPARGDRRMLRQVLENLLSNAVKFSGPTPDGTIEFGGSRKGEENAYFVRDEGVGFDPRYEHKLFGVFQRLHHADEFEGTGVGLAIVKRIIEKHGGRVWAESAPGEGATFWFTLSPATLEHERVD